MIRQWFSREALEATPSLPGVAGDERVYAIGDIHGRLDLLLRLLDRIEGDASRFDDGRRPRLVFLGDYIDRGDASRGVLDALISLGRSGTPDIVFLRGNHEEALLAFLRDPVAGRRWLEFGAAQTLSSYGLPAPPLHPDETWLAGIRDRLLGVMGAQVGFLEGLRAFHASGQVLFTHAGVNPEPGLHLFDRESMLWGNAACVVDDPVPGLRIVHGHLDARDAVVTRGRICVDTGAYYSGRLTAVRLDQGTGLISVSAGALD